VSLHMRAWVTAGSILQERAVLTPVPRRLPLALLPFPCCNPPHASLPCRLISHAYMLHITLLTSGNRIGAAAAEKLRLFARNAVNTYR
jgi:hypothetical protein